MGYLYIFWLSFCLLEEQDKRLIHYKDLYYLEDCTMYTHIKCPTTIRKYDKKCLINLATEYDHIVKYSKARFEP